MIGVVVLAAGNSSRLGSPKQLLRCEGVSLVRRATLQAIRLGAGPVAVVCGADAARVSAEVADLAVLCTLNLDWDLGMGNSLKFGLRRLLERHPKLEGLGVLLCDQPRVPNAAYARLLEEFRANPERIVAAYYKQRCGVPAIFPARAFDALLAIGDAEGAKGVLEGGDPIGVAIPEAAFDIDTVSDFEQLAFSGP